MAVLKKVSPEPAGQLIEIKGDPFVIGRLGECQVVLDSNGVSRKHAEIRRPGDRYTLVDLNSRNFTFLNGRKVAPETAPPVLETNDRIKICDVEFVFFPHPPSASSAGPADDRRRDDGPGRAGRDLRGAAHPRRLAVEPRWPAPSGPRSSSGPSWRFRGA